MTLSPGQRLGPYEILAPLGAGGMGEVYKAKDTRLDRFVAVKVLPEHLAKHPDSLARFEREAKAVAALSHPNILAIHDFATHEAMPFVVMELLEGESLRTRLEQGPLPSRKATELAVQMARGLAAAHEKGVVHRDLKPDNLWITKDGRLKILDFGLAKQLQTMGSTSDSFMPTEAFSVGHQTEQGMVLGTVGYMSPEQVRGLPADGRSDLFSFGVVLFEMLAGRRAFQGNSPIETMNAILKDEPPELKDLSRPVSPGLHRVLQHCLEKDPAHRFQDAHDLAFALDNLSGSEAVAPFTAPFAPQNRRATRLWGGLAALLVLGAGSVGWALRTRPPVEAAFQRLTFQRGTVEAARFAPDGRTIIYSARWQGRPPALFSIHAGSLESQPLNIGAASLLAISPSNELAIQLAPVLSYGFYMGKLARVPLGGGGARDIQESVLATDWNPESGELALTTVRNAQWQLESPPGKVLCTSAFLDFPRFARRGGTLAFFEGRIGPGWSLFSEPGVIAILDRSGGKRVLTSSKPCTGLAWSAKGDEVWYSECENGSQTQLWAVTLAGKRRLIWSAAGNLALQDIAPDGRVLIQMRQIQDGVLSLDASSLREQDLSIFDGSSAPDITADGSTLLINERGSGGGVDGSVFLHRKDGSPPIKLSKGRAEAFSPDGRQVLTSYPGDPSHYYLIPTGSGQPRALDLPDVDFHQMAWFLPDGQRIIFQGQKRERPFRQFMLDLRDPGPPKPITPEGTVVWMGTYALSPDGRQLVLHRDSDTGGINEIFPLEGGSPRPIPGLGPRDIPIRWSPDGRGLFVFNRESLPTRIFRLDLTTGGRQLLKEFMPADPGGIAGMSSITMTPDARTFAFNYRRRLSDLFVVDGLK